MSKEMIDRKFKFVAVNPCNQKVYTEENAVVFCAKDEAFLDILPKYLEACERRGSNPEHLESILLLTGRVAQYQEFVESKVPDTDLDCEIDRCIGGNV